MAERNFNLELQEKAQKMKAHLYYPHHWAVAPGANSRRVEALKNLMRIKTEGLIPVLKEIKVNDPEAYADLKNQILTFVRAYFLSEVPVGFSVVHGSLNSEDLYVIEKDAKDFIELLHRTTGDIDFDPEIVFKQEIAVHVEPETPEQLREKEILEDQVLRFRYRLSVLAGISKDPKLPDGMKVARTDFFSDSLVKEFIALRNKMNQLQTGEYVNLRNETIVFIRENLLNDKGANDLDLIDGLSKFAEQAGDANFFPERMFSEDLGFRPDGTRSAYLLYRNLSKSLDETMDEDPKNPKRTLRNFIVKRENLEIVYKLASRDQHSIFKMAFAAKLKKHIQRLKLHEDFSFDTELETHLTAMAALLGDVDLLKPIP